MLDEDGGGSLSRRELQRALARVGYELSDEELETFLNEVDTDGSGDIDFSEFVQCMVGVREAKHGERNAGNPFALGRGGGGGGGGGGDGESSPVVRFKQGGGDSLVAMAAAGASPVEKFKAQSSTFDCVQDITDESDEDDDDR